MIFRQDRTERYWVPRADEEYWIRWWGAGGVPAARWKDYVRWGHSFWPPTRDDVIRAKVMLQRKPRKRTNYARWKGY